MPSSWLVNAPLNSSVVVAGFRPVWPGTKR